jgi:hypothetical protein
VVLWDFYAEMGNEVSDNHQADFPSNMESSYGFSATSKQYTYMKLEVFTAIEIVAILIMATFQQNSDLRSV